MRANPEGHFRDASRLAATASGRPLSTSEVSRFWKNRALDFISSHPGDFFRLLGAKVLLLLNRYEIPNNENYQYLRTLSPFLALLPGAARLDGQRVRADLEKAADMMESCRKEAAIRQQLAAGNDSSVERG